MDVNSVENGYDKIILQERNVNYPVSNYEEIKLKNLETEDVKNNTNFDNFIGRSFRLKEYPYEDGMNVGYPAVDPLEQVNLRLIHLRRFAFQYVQLEDYLDMHNLLFLKKLMKLILI